VNVLNTKIIIVLSGYVLGFIIGSVLLRRILILVDPSNKENFKNGFRNIGLWIGICEHFMIITFILVDEYTAIGLIFAAKEFVRSEKIKEKPSYYLLGTLLSISFALFFGIATKLLLQYCS